MRTFSRHPFRYTWRQAIVDAFWLTVVLTLLVKVVEALSAQG